MPREVSPPEGNPRDASGGVDPVGEGHRPGAGQDAALPPLHENGGGRALCVPSRGHGSRTGQAAAGTTLPSLPSRAEAPPYGIFLPPPGPFSAPATTGGSP